jgi:hypothetical protein
MPMIIGIKLSPITFATRLIRSNYDSTKVCFAYFGFYSWSDPGKKKTRCVARSS